MYPVNYVSVDDDPGISVDIGGNQKLKASLSDGEDQTVEEVHLDSGIAVVHVV